MSINHLFSSTPVKLNIQCNNINSLERCEVKDLLFDCKNGDTVEMSSLDNHGVFGQVIKSDGTGNVFWGNDLTGGVNFNGTLPTANGQLAFYSGIDGTTIRNGTLTENDITSLQTQVSTNTSDIKTNSDNIATNTSDIKTNSDNIATNTSDIKTNSDNIATNTADIKTNSDNIATNTSDIKTNADNISTNTTNIGNLENDKLNRSGTQNMLGNLNMGTNSIINTLNITTTGTIETSTLKTNTIQEKTLASGVSVSNSEFKINNTVAPSVLTMLSTGGAQGGLVQSNTDLALYSNRNVILQSEANELKISTLNGIINKDVILDHTLGTMTVKDYNLDMNTTNNITKCNNLQTQEIKATDGVSINIQDDINIGGYDLVNVNEIKTDNLTTNTLGKVLVGTELDLNNNNITNVNNISCVNGNFSSTTNTRGLLNYAKNGVDTLVDVGKWVVSDGIKGLYPASSTDGQVFKKYYSATTSDEARTLTINGGTGILNLSVNTTNDIKTAFVTFLTTDIIVPSNSKGVIRVSSTGVVAFSTASTNTSRYFILADVVTDTDSLLFIDNKRFIGTNYLNNVYSNNLNIGTYFAQGTIQPIIQNITPLKLNSTYSFPYTYNGIEYTGTSKTEINFWRYYRDTTEILGYKQLAQTLLIDNLYDNGSNVLVVVPDGYYKKDLFYMTDTTVQIGENYKFSLIYSTGIYPTLKEAQLALNPEVPSFFPKASVQLCAIITSVNNLGSTVVIEEIQDARRFLTSEIPYASRDDHAQYLLLDGSRSMTGNLNVNNNDIVNCDELKVDKLTSSTTTKILINNDLDFQNTYNLLNIDSINNIRPSGGVYSKTSQLSLAGVQTNIDLLQATFQGSKSVPANAFTVGQMYSIRLGGSLTCNNNDIFSLEICSNCSGVSAIFNTLTIQVDGSQSNSFWNIQVDFAIRAVGAAGVASVVSSAFYDYYTTGTQYKKGYGSTNVNSTTFDTTGLNELFIRYSTANATVTFVEQYATMTRYY